MTGVDHKHEILDLSRGSTRCILDRSLWESQNQTSRSYKTQTYRYSHLQRAFMGGRGRGWVRSYCAQTLFDR